MNLREYAHIRSFSPRKLLQDKEVREHEGESRSVRASG